MGDTFTSGSVPFSQGDFNTMGRAHKTGSDLAVLNRRIINVGGWVFNGVLLQFHR